jgi:DNA invertase Pin-like site-specific DNA recombinase
MPDATIPARSWTAIYTRQSRSTPGDFSSCEARLSVCLKFVMARLGDGWVWSWCKRYDDEGQSGETLDRPGLQRLLADVCAGSIDRVVAHRLDRLSKERFMALNIGKEVLLNDGPPWTIRPQTSPGFHSFPPGS